MLSLSSNLARRALVRQLPAVSFTRTFANDHGMKHLVINAVGADRPGIISDLTYQVTEAGGSVGESHSQKLGHFFSVMALVTVPSDAVDNLKQELAQVQNLETKMFETDAVAKASAPTIGYSGKFTLSGADHPGIVHKVTALLTSKGFSIESLKTTQEEIAPHGGTTLFVMQGIGHVYEPLHADFDADATKAELLALGEAMNCDLVLQDVDDNDDEYASSVAS